MRVNRALARPYQLDPAYDVVEGAYRAGFNPAAGLISTVADLARFDLALDRDLLIGADAKEQMFAPAYPTHEGQDDLAYGLGWYSQEFMGTRLAWHSGRWPPSTSSLYLKVPDENLTLVLLANTTYLNTPYPFGHGDALYCTPALAFYKAFVFPRRAGAPVPEVDWEAGEDELVTQLQQVRSLAARRLLERELWSYRQMYASQNRVVQASRLASAHARAYPRSPASDLDTYAYRGVEYHPGLRARVQVSEAELARLAHAYRLVEAPGVDAADLPPEFNLQVREGRLVGVNAEGCVSLVPLTPTRFAIPENPGLTLEFALDGERVESLTLQAGELAVVYEPEPDTAKGGVGALFRDARAEIER